MGRAHLETLSTERDVDGRPVAYLSFGDLTTFFGIPLSVGAVLWLTGVQAPKPDPLLASISILTGLLFALVVLVFDQVKRERDRPAPEAGNDPLMDAWQLFANVCWAVVASTLLLTVMFTTVLFVDGKLAPWLTALVTTLFLHLMLTLLMVLKRIFFMARRIAGILFVGRR
ncbi:hypothetical protein [uncultured Modestobacter sp.]|uniref:hypothetical protein n=1 Tax=uncultured Modestobacter sp. TaxID=380048 RepID=UPI00263900B0|nr:hypothetical protein [uncultured Modestobacter sp.]